MFQNHCKHDARGLSPNQSTQRCGSLQRCLTHHQHPPRAGGGPARGGGGGGGAPPRGRSLCFSTTASMMQGASHLIKALRDVALYSGVVPSSKLAQPSQQLWCAGGHEAWCDNRLDALIPQVLDPLQEGLRLCQCLLSALLIPLCAVPAAFLSLQSCTLSAQMASPLVQCCTWSVFHLAHELLPVLLLRFCVM